MRTDKICGNCKWYRGFEGVCVNSDSRHCANFVDKEGACDEWGENGEN